MNARLHPLFAQILGSIEQQPLVLHRAAAKACDRRFSAEPLTGFGGLGDERCAEISADELEDQRADERREREEAGL